MKIANEPDNNIISELRDLLLRMYDLVSDITTIDETIEVSKYVLRYNYRLHYTKYDLNIMKSVENKLLTWLVHISDELDLITVYDNYFDALYHIENILRNDNEYSEKENE